MVKVREDMTGWVMSEHGVPDSRLTVIKQTNDYVDINGVHHAMWLRKCNCKDQNETIVRGIYIRNGSVLSCGCIKSERTIAFNKETKAKTNKYSEKLCDEYGEYYIGYTNNTGKEFYIDAEDYNKIKDYCWYEYNGRNTTCRIKTNICGKSVLMHVFLGFAYYDHIDRNELNNRRCNLRLCLHAQNSRNRSIPRNNTSGFIGVLLNKKCNKWTAQIVVNGVHKYLGLFASKTDAIKARLMAEQEYFGEFAPQIHLFKKYGITQQNDLGDKCYGKM